MNFGHTSILSYRFQDLDIAFELLSDAILEGTEVGQLTIYPDQFAFDGHEPLFRDVRIVIRDGKMMLNQDQSIKV